MTEPDKTTAAACWELEDCEWAFKGLTKRSALLAAGWEPFAVSNGSIWFRRQCKEMQDAG